MRPLTKTLSRLLWGALLPLLHPYPGLARQQDDLSGLVEELVQQSPALQAARRSVDALEGLVVPARTLPDPSVTIETMGNLLPPTLQTGDPSSARVIRFSQEIPFPGKLNLRAQIVSAQVDLQWWKYEELRRELIAELKTAYYDLFLAQKTAEVVEKTRALLQQFADISAARYKVGQAAQQDVLKAQVEVSKLLDRLAVLHRDQETARAKINSLLFRKPESPLTARAELKRPNLDSSLDQIYEKVVAANPQVRARRKEIDRSELQLALARKDRYPDFEVGFSYFNRPQMPEMYGFMVTAKIPLYFWRKQRPALESATSDLIVDRHRYEDTLSTLYFRVKDPYLRTRTDGELLSLYGDAIIPQATLALESSISSYRVGGVDFLTLLSNLTTLLEYETKYYEVMTDYYKALVVLESLTGESLIP